MTTLPAVRRASVVPRSLSVALSLARVEARKLLRHPLVVLGSILPFAITIGVTWRDVPVLNRHDSLTVDALVPLAATVLIAAHLATMRSRRYKTTELLDSLVTSDATVTAAHLLSVMYVSFFALVLVIVQLTYMKVIGGVAAPRPVVILIGPTLVAFAGGFGVALGRWAPRMFAAPLGLSGLVALSTVLIGNTYQHNREWLSLWVPGEGLAGIASEITLRPQGWRLGYFLGLVAIAASIAFIHHASKRVIAACLALVALLGTFIAAIQLAKENPRSLQTAITTQLREAWENPSCREFSSVAYCPLPGYEPWIDRWRKPTEGVLAAAPAEARPTDLRLLQAPGNSESYDEDRNNRVSRWLHREWRRGTLALETDIHPSMRWGRNSAQGESELSIALMVAARTIGVDTRFRLTDNDLQAMGNPPRSRFKAGRRYSQCGTLEQGRAIVGLWLAAQATDGTEAAFYPAAARAPYQTERSDVPPAYFDPVAWNLIPYTYGTLDDYTVVWGARETKYALQLIEQDEAEVRAMVAKDWVQLIDPATTTDQAAAILGLSPLPSLEEALDNWGLPYRGMKQFGYVPCH